MKVKEEMLEVDPALKKKRRELLDAESDLDDEFIEEYENLIEEKETERQQKKLEKDNEKRKEDGLKALKLDDLPTPKEKENSLEKLEKQYENYTEKIKALKLQKLDKVRWPILLMYRYR